MSLEQLINLHGVSGNEESVRNYLSKEIRPCVDAISVDRLGNLIAHKKGKKPTVMLAAHMDEIGLMVKNIEEHGRINFSPIGGVDKLVLVGQRVFIHGKQQISGVITSQDILDSSYSSGEVEDIDLFIDANLSKKELIKKGVKPGTYVSFEGCTFCKMSPFGFISGKALDDRIGCYILLELAKSLKNTKNDIFYVFTVQEEIGLYGSKVSAYSINPDWAIVVDVTNSDYKDKTKILGKGPCVTVKDAEMLGNKHINSWLEKLAKKMKIPLQYDVSEGGTTDALSISVSRGGKPTTAVGVAVKNLHSSIGVTHMDDIKNTIRLLEKLLKKPPRILV